MSFSERQMSFCIITSFSNISSIKFNTMIPWAKGHKLDALKSESFVVSFTPEITQ